PFSDGAMVTLDRAAALCKDAALHAVLAVVLVYFFGFVGPAAAQSDTDFLRAKEAFERGERAKLDALAPGLKGHLLAPYVTYWQIKLGIDDVDYDTVRAFLSQYRNAPIADKLTVEWLKTEATRGDWTRFAL